MASEAAARLLSCGAEGRGAAVSVVATLLANLAREPSNPKFRRVPTTNARVAGALALPGAVELLSAAGFKREDEVLVVGTSEVETGALAASALADLDKTAIAAASPFLVALRFDHVPHGARSCCSLGVGVAHVSGAMDNLVRLWPGHANCDGVWCTNEARVVVEAHQRARGADGVLALCELTPMAVGATTGLAFASAGRDGRILVWRNSPDLTRPPTLSATLVGHGDAQGAEVSNSQVVVALTPLVDGRLASVGWDQTLRVWAVAALSGDADAISSHVVLGSKGAIGSACLAVCETTDKAIAVGYGDGVVRLWREDTLSNGDFNICGSFSTGTVVRGLAAMDRGGIAQCGNDGFVHVWRADAAGAYRAVASSPSVGTYVFCIAASPRADDPQGQWEVFSGSDDGLMRAWREGCESQKELRCVQAFGAGGAVWSIDVVGDGDLLVAADTGGVLLISRAPSRAGPKSLQQSQLAAQQAYAGANEAADVARPPATASGAPLAPGSGVPPTSGGGVVDGQRYDFVFPVEMGGGASQIYWNQCDDPRDVAARFALRNGVPPDEVQDIVNFIHRASGSTPTGAGNGTVPANTTADEQANRIAQLVSMGFDRGRSRTSLEKTGWDVEAALAILLS